MVAFMEASQVFLTYILMLSMSAVKGIYRVKSLTTQPPESAKCVKQEFRLYLLCVVTIYHTAPEDLSPSVLEKLPDKKRTEYLRRVLCSCPEGSVGWWCVSAVKDAIEEYRHDRLCMDSELDHHRHMETEPEPTYPTELATLFSTTTTSYSEATSSVSITESMSNEAKSFDDGQTPSEPETWNEVENGNPSSPEEAVGLLETNNPAKSKMTTAPSHSKVNVTTDGRASLTILEPVALP